MKNLNKKSTFWLFLIIVLAALLRIYKINSPILDLYPIRQEQCAMLARNFFREGLNILNGRVDWYGNLNPRWILELPLISYLSALCYKLFGVRESIGRMISVLFSIGSISIFYFLIKDLFDKRMALLSTFIFSIIPLNIYFNRVFMPEPLLMFFTIALLWSFNRWLETDRITLYVIAVFSGALLLLTKISMCILLPLLVYLAYLRWKGRIFVNLYLWVFCLAVILPATFWYSISNLKALELLTCTSSRLEILSKPHFYLRILESFIIFLCTPIGLFAFVAGFIKRPLSPKQGAFYIWFALLVLYVLIAPERHYIHYYYQLPFAPVVAVFIARGLVLFADSTYWKETFLENINTKLLIAIFLILMLILSFVSIQPFYKFNRNVYEAGLTIRELTPPDSLIIAGRCTQEAPLYYCDRKGWEINEEGNLSNTLLYSGVDLPRFKNELHLLEYLIKQGADYYLACNLAVFNANQELVSYLENKFELMSKTDSYFIYNLNKKKNVERKQ